MFVVLEMRFDALAFHYLLQNAHIRKKKPRANRINYELNSRGDFILKNK